MFKSRSKKNKIKAVFKLQFQATQVPKMKKSTVMIALVPDDVGKPKVKLEKVSVQDGTCLWEKPIFESVKLVRDTKSGKLQEKIYHFVVSTGSSKSGFLGESSIDLADFAAETEPLTVSLPLKFANSGAILHVTIQNVEGVHIDQRNEEDNGNGSLRHQLSICSADEGSHNVHDFPKLLPTLRQNSMPSGTIEAIATKVHMHWGSMGSASDRSLGNYWTNSLEDTLPRERLQEPSDNVTENLKSEIASLKRKVEASELELQSLQKLMEKECSRGQSMSRQIISLREERNMIKTKYEQLLSQQNVNDKTKTSKALQNEIEDARLKLEAIKEELVHEKEFSSNIQLQLQKTQNSNSELLLAVRELEAMLEQKNKELLDNKEHDATELGTLKQKIADQNGQLDIYYKQREELNDHIKELNFECELLKKENLNMSLRLKHGEAQHIVLQNKHSASLATIEQLESEVQRLEEKIKKQAYDFSDSLLYINELENRVGDLEKQAEKIEEDFHAMKCAKLEQEARAIQAEETLIKTRHDNGLTCQHFQDEYRSLSVEMTLKVEENEKKTMEAYAEADELRKQKKHTEEMLQKCNQELGLITNQNELKLQQLLNQIDSKEKTIEMMSEKLEAKSKQLEDVQWHMVEKDEALAKQIQFLRIEIRKLIAEELTLSKAEPVEYMTTMLTQENNDEEIRLGTLMSEVEIFKTQHNGLKHNLHMEQAEKENMKKKISHLEGELQKKQEELSAVEKRMNNSKGLATASNMDSWHYESAASETQKGMDDANTPVDKSVIGRTMCNSDENKACLAAHTSVVQTCSENEAILFNYDHANEEMSRELLTSQADLNEVTILKERNEYMGTQLKEMEERYSEISLKFAEVEGERQQLVMALRNLRNDVLLGWYLKKSITEGLLLLEALATLPGYPKHGPEFSHDNDF
ncbi:early endosome antigen 1 isoform X2 [Cajanus cajan]|uniref:early endosome antigen 1 isoform X2 n=1 Tax=Cajanus cajan TaxID=3821 RepID=UPI0010FB9CD6|nr:early endosome antigen 1 isoform X2 [Cajanus cajan]